MLTAATATATTTTLTTTTTSSSTTTIVNVTTANPALELVDKYDSFKKQKENEDFYKRLIEFHRHKNVNTPLTQLPTFNGRLIDLYKLYTIVTSMGGWERICEKDKWSQVGIELDSKLFKSCLNGSHALKIIYIRYLSLYEKFDYQMSYSASLMQGASISSLLDPLNNFNNPSLTHSISSSLLNGIGAAISGGNGSSLSNVSSLGYHKNSAPNLEDALDSDLNRRRFSYLLDITPMNYNYNQHNHLLSNSSGITSSTTNGYMTNNPYEKMEISLISGFPNEIDFVFNSIVLLSSDESHAFKIYQSPRLLDLMLAHIGFFGINDKFNLRSLYDNYWTKNENENDNDDAKSDKEEDETFELFLKHDDLDLLNKKYSTKLKKMNKRNFVKFWHNSIQFPLNDDFDQKDLLETLLPKLYNDYLKTLPSQELLNLREMKDDLYDGSSNSLQTASIEYRRIEQVMVILNNLSFEDNNANYMANKCPSLFEFLIMCLYCTNINIELRKHALDILANLSRKIKLKLLNDKHKRLLIMSLYHLIIGLEDRPNEEEKNKIDIEIETTKLITSEERLDVIRGLEILTKLCSQEQLDSLDDDYTNEKILAKYFFECKTNTKRSCLFLDKVFTRLEELLTIQDVLILLHSLEFLYNISQYNQFICNMIVGSQKSFVQQSKIISILVNFLTVDMTHFGVQNINNNTPSDSSNNTQNKQPGAPVAPIKMYKVMPSNGQIIATTTTTTNNPTVQQQSQQPLVVTASSNQSPPVVHYSTQQSNNLKSNSLLQQTLNNQHLNNSNSNSTLNSSIKIINNVQQANQIMNTNNNQNYKPNNEQQAKNILCNWLVTCFQADSSSELSKTQLYPYYQQISKLNNWTVLTIPTFFEILNATFPHLRYDEDTNKIQGLKLVLNLKQQLELKQKFAQNKNLLPIQIQSQPTVLKTEETNGKLPENINNVNKQLSTSSVPLSPPPSVSIYIQTPSIPLLTPPTPPVSINHVNSPSQVPTVKQNTVNEIPISTSATPSIKTNQTQIKEEITENNNSDQQQSQNDSTVTNTQTEQKISVLTNGSNKANLLNGLSKDGSNNEILNHNEDSRSSISSSSSSSSNTKEIKIDKIDEKSNKENDSLLKRKQLAETNESQIEADKLAKQITKTINETNANTNTTDSIKQITESTINSNSSSPVKKKKLKINEMEDFMNKPMAPITISTPSLTITTPTIQTQSQPQPLIQQPPVQIQTQVSQVSNSSLVIKENQETDSSEKIIVNQQSNYSNVNMNGNSIINTPKDLNDQIKKSTEIESVKEAYTSTGDYLCEWNNCNRYFVSSKAVYNHVCKYHLLSKNQNSDNDGLLCLWTGCDQIKRQKWSLVNHLLERHCNENAMKTAIMCRQRGMMPVVNNQTLSNSYLNYNKDAAFFAIQRHQRLKKEDFLSSEEGPITKSIRLLSALTLRNLARNSEKAKKSIKMYESQLANIAFDLLESSNAISNCLWHLTH